jgi:hypothetical protein
LAIDLEVELDSNFGFFYAIMKHLEMVKKLAKYANVFGGAILYLYSQHLDPS